MFTIAGVSTHNNVAKVRFSNVKHYAKMLEKLGHTNITLVTLPFEMEKSLAVSHLMTTDLMDNPVTKSAIETADVKYNQAENANKSPQKKEQKKPKKNAPKVGIAEVFVPTEAVVETV